MAGKSTYLRQVALIVLMAQIGSFVPAKSAEIGLVDRVFTRVGAADDLAGGQSTFMVEMTEVANILHHASPKSLIILDEVGRGTSTFDGLAIAWAVTEHIHDPERIGAKTLFATHYHELTRLADELPGLANVSVAVRREGEDVRFLRRIVPGGADESYGIEVAKLAGLPRSVLARAREVLANLDRVENQTSQGGQRESGAPPAPALSARHQHATSGPVEGQLGLFGVGAAAAALLEKLRGVNVSNTTPLAALNVLAALVDEAQLLGDAESCASEQEAAAGREEQG